MHRFDSLPANIVWQSANWMLSGQVWTMSFEFVHFFINQQVLHAEITHRGWQWSTDFVQYIICMWTISNIPILSVQNVTLGFWVALAGDQHGNPQVLLANTNIHAHVWTVSDVRGPDCPQINHYPKWQNNQQLPVDYPNSIYTYYGNYDKPQAYIDSVYM